VICDEVDEVGSVKEEGVLVDEELAPEVAAAAVGMSNVYAGISPI
jgi:hypothetical protein